jgi:hypothetical protein
MLAFAWNYGPHNAVNSTALESLPPNAANDEHQISAKKNENGRHKS